MPFVMVFVFGSLTVVFVACSFVLSTAWELLPCCCNEPELSCFVGGQLAAPASLARGKTGTSLTCLRNWLSATLPDHGSIASTAVEARSLATFVVNLVERACGNLQMRGCQGTRRGAQAVARNRQKRCAVNSEQNNVKVVSRKAVSK